MHDHLSLLRGSGEATELFGGMQYKWNVESQVARQRTGGNLLVRIVYGGYPVGKLCKSSKCVIPSLQVPAILSWSSKIQKESCECRQFLICASGVGRNDDSRK